VTLEQNPEQVRPAPALRIAFAPGVTVGKWTARWAERHPDLPLEVLAVSDTDARSILFTAQLTVSFARLPIDRDGLSVIRLYGEVPVLVVPRDSVFATRESVTATEVASLAGVVDYPTAGNVKDAVALVAAGVGALRLPHSVARWTARKDVVAVPIADGTETEIAICWIADQTSPLIDDFVGIVRGRTAQSSRGR
jgi:DNA-binding transcriptional LysR family regulator